MSQVVQPKMRRVNSVAVDLRGLRHDADATDAPSSSDQHVFAGDAEQVLYAEDLQVGDCWTTCPREISGDDVEQFASLTGDHTPLHGDAAAESPFGKPIAHGLLGLSVLAGLGTDYPKTSTLAFVGIDEWKFLAPVFFGDVVRARNEVLEIVPHGRRAAKVRWLRQLLNEAGRVVQEGHFITLVGSKTRNASKPR